ncbi:DNA metabolism protein [Taibaiella sp. KBW10]|uniref:TIGR03915 family putative DNA repair protein n=1 Tax=Taibaiella sp. KBW10 TaxID=2153357 RepID=UPI000F58FE1F|nr:TIGR03915 family putative DNA repair protein [Taibaiella sp. KBW10]RQO30313.1 DNA metabolism protein [Taibaiella sp. KBW10]
MIYVFDGSFEGLLSAVFDCFERRHTVSRLLEEHYFQGSLFEAPHIVHTSSQKSDRVWKGIAKKMDKDWQRKLYCAFLSEQADMYDTLFKLIHSLFCSEAIFQENYGDALILDTAQTAKKVEREKHRMKAFTRFEKSGDGLFFCAVAPDFNVLPLIIRFFRNRYADQPWLIYDQKRKYGIHYDTHSVQRVEIVPESLSDTRLSTPLILDEKEALYATLWKDYFKSTNIEARNNPKLHVQHVPKRYWRFLTEKQ